MITIIFGKPGSGKTSLLTHFLIDTYLTQRQELLKFTRKQIGEANKTRQKRLTVPDKPPPSVPSIF